MTIIVYFSLIEEENAPKTKLITLLFNRAGWRRQII